MRFIPRLARNLFIEAVLPKLLLQILLISYDWLSSVPAAKIRFSCAVCLLIDNHRHKTNFLAYNLIMNPLEMPFKFSVKVNKTYIL